MEFGGKAAVGSARKGGFGYRLGLVSAWVGMGLRGLARVGMVLLCGLKRNAAALEAMRRFPYLIF